jgi:hypothetical protein
LAVVPVVSKYAGGHTAAELNDAVPLEVTEVISQSVLDAGVFPVGNEGVP